MPGAEPETAHPGAGIPTTLTGRKKAAVLLVSLGSDRAAEIFKYLDEAESETSPEVIKEVEKVLRQKLSNVISQEYAASGGVKPLAELLNYVDRATERNVLDALAERDAELAEEIRMLLF